MVEFTIFFFILFVNVFVLWLKTSFVMFRTHLFIQWIIQQITMEVTVHRTELLKNLIRCLCHSNKMYR